MSDTAPEEPGKLKGYAAAGFTPAQAEFLSTLFNIVKTLAEAHAVKVLEEAAILRRVLESKGFVTDEEIEAERKRQEQSFRQLIDLESMVDPEFKKGVEQIEDMLRRQSEEDAGGTPAGDE
jgi:hypothetical protein